MQPHRRQLTRLHRPWDSPGKNTGVGCHFLLQCMKVKSESEFAPSCPTLCDPTDCSPPDSFVHGIFQARVLEWGAIAFSDSGPGWCSNTQAHFWKELIKTSLSQSISLTLASHLYPYHFLSSQHSKAWIFPNFVVYFPPFLCVYYFTIYCLELFPYSKKNMLSESERYI